MFSNPKFWLIALLAVAVLPFLILKIIGLTGKKPDRPTPPTRLPHCPGSPNCVCSEDPRATHTIAPLKFQGEATAAWAQLRSVLEDLGGNEIRADDRYLWFEFRTPLIRFVDDVECRLAAKTQQIEIRSASRAGHRDFGTNKKRVESIREAFKNAQKRGS